MPDAAYYQELIEKRWSEIEPDIRLIRADWDCYEYGAPKGIDVIMYDAVKRDALINGYTGRKMARKIPVNIDFTGIS